MTLSEYLNQNPVVKMPKVILNENEYKKGITIKLPLGETRTEIFITDEEFNKRFPEVNYYIQRNNYERLYAVNTETGKMAGLSCFYIK